MQANLLITLADSGVDVGWIVGIAIICAIVGLVGGFFGCRYLVKKEMRDNPPINEKMIRAMFLSMGRKPSEAQIQSVIRSMNDANKTGGYKGKKNR